MPVDLIMLLKRDLKMAIQFWSKSIKKIQMQKSVSNTVSLARVLINFYRDFDSASCCIVFTKKLLLKFCINLKRKFSCFSSKSHIFWIYIGANTFEAWPKLTDIHKGIFCNCSYIFHGEIKFWPDSFFEYLKTKDDHS